MEVDNLVEVFYTHGYISHYIYPINVTRFIITCRLFLFAHTSHVYQYSILSDIVIYIYIRYNYIWYKIRQN